MSLSTSITFSSLASILLIATTLGFVSSASLRGEDGYFVDEAKKGRKERKARDEEIVLDAVVIGAGWAGIGAARTLLDAGVTNIEVLEARNYIGGRSRTVDLGDDARVELGSQWIHGSVAANPITSLARLYDFRLAKSFFSSTTYSNVYGGSFPKEIDDAELAEEYMEDYENGFFPYQETLQDTTDSDRSLRQVANAFERKVGMSGDRLLYFEHNLMTWVVHDYAADIRDLSLWWWNDGKAYGNSDSVVVDGYSALIEKYAGPLNTSISFRSVVSSIDSWDSDTLEVTFKRGSSSHTVKANVVIVTLPIGVLKAGDVSFSPSLPWSKRKAINALGSGSFVKALLGWDDSTVMPWNSETHFMERINPLESTERWCSFYNNRPTLGTNTVIGITTGEEARRVELLSDEKILDEIMEAFDSMFGDDVVPRPKNFKVSRWDADPYSKGAYSYMSVGSDPKFRSDLGKSTGRVLWAGEATNVEYAATTHGAIQSGIEAGQQALSILDVSNNDGGEIECSDMVWNDMPDGCKEIAKKLGYTKNIWNNDGTPKAIDEYWSDLSKKQRTGLETLGFNEATWNDDDYYYDDDDDDYYY